MTDQDESGEESSTKDEANRDSAPEAAPVSAEPDRREAKRERAARPGKRAARESSARKAAPAPAASSVRSSSAMLFAVLALAAGGAAGWFGHIAQAKAALRNESGPAPAGSAAGKGPCDAWEKKICAGGGDESAACQQAKGATELLTPSLCEVALEAMPATLAKVKSARVPCETLVSKLCTDLPPGSQTCGMVKERTPSFPGARCREMLGTYDQVLAELKMLDEQMGNAQMGMGMPPGAMPPGAMPPGAAPSHP